MDSEYVPGPALTWAQKIVRVLYVCVAQNSGHCNESEARFICPKNEKVAKVKYSLNAKSCNVRGVGTFVF